MRIDKHPADPTRWLCRVLLCVCLSHVAGLHGRARGEPSLMSDSPSSLRATRVEEATVHIHVICSETCRSAAAPALPGLWCVRVRVCVRGAQGNDEKFPRMIDADSKPPVVAVSTAATKPDNLTLAPRCRRCRARAVPVPVPVPCWSLRSEDSPHWSVLRSAGFAPGVPRAQVLD